MTLSDWSDYVSKLPDLENVAPFAEKVLGVLSRSMGVASNQHFNAAVSHFKDKRCIVTKLGMKKPSESYFKNVNLFQDLPIVAFESKAVSDKLLEFMGVRKVSQYNY